jgi:hypothetical protein
MDEASAVRSAQEGSAEQWLVDFLKDKSILWGIGLQQVIYSDEHTGEQTAEVGWICEKHLQRGLQTKQLQRYPC